MKNNEKSVLVFAYKYCHQDPRILREIGALVDEGYNVDFICAHNQSVREPILEGVRVFPITMERKRQSALRYLFEYVVFAISVFFKVNYLYFQNQYKIIIPFVMPEFLVLNCIIPKIFGAKILTDWEDPSREVFLSKFKAGRYNPFLLLISIFENLCVWLSNKIITPNEGFRRAFVYRGHDREKIHIVLNAPDMKIFQETNEIITPDRFTALYGGSIVERHGLHILIEAIPAIVREIPDFLLLIYGSHIGDYLDSCRSRWAELNLQRNVKFMDGVHITKMPEVIRSSSIGVIPNIDTPFTRINFPQRIFEFGLFKKPMLVSRLPGIQDYYDEESICFFEPGNSKDLAEKMIALYQSHEKQQGYVNRAYEISKKLNWKEPFLDIVEQLSKT